MENFDKKNNIQNRDEQLKNLEEKYTATAGYIKNNKNNMNDEMLRNIEKKQEKRKNQINDYVD